MLQQTVTDYHKRLRSALCHHGNQPQQGQGHMLDTDVDLLLSQASLNNSFSSCGANLYDTFGKQSVVSDHNLNNFKNNQAQVNNDVGCYGYQGHHTSSSSLYYPYYIRSTGFRPIQNGDSCRDFDVNAWYDRHYNSEVPNQYGQSNASLTESKSTPSGEKLSLWFLDQVLHKPGCTATGDDYRGLKFRN